MQQVGAWMEKNGELPGPAASWSLGKSRAQGRVQKQAVSELATLRGKKAHDASALLTRELGPPLDSNALVRTPAPDLAVSVSPQGFHVERGPHSLGLALVLVGGAELFTGNHP